MLNALFGQFRWEEFDVDCDAQLKELKVKIVEGMHLPSEGEAPSLARASPHRYAFVQGSLILYLEENVSFKSKLYSLQCVLYDYICHIHPQQ